MADLRIPDLGEGVECGTLLTLLVVPGTFVKRDQPLLEVETDKVTLEIPSPADGVLEEWTVIPGCEVRPSEVVGRLALVTALPADYPTAVGDLSKDASMTAPAVVSMLSAQPDAEVLDDASRAAQAAVAAAAGISGTVIAAGPAARREARELGVTLAAVAQACAGRRVTRGDVREYVKKAQREEPRAAARSALPDLRAYGAVQEQALTRIERATALNMSHTVSTVAHAWVARVVDITVLERARRELRQQQSAGQAPLTLTAVLCKTLAVVLREFPRFNAAYDAERHALVLREYLNLGVAVDTEQGLFVPVLRNVDQRSMTALSTELAELSARLRAGDRSSLLRHAAGMTVSNLGGLGVSTLQPLVNWPEVAILGVGAIEERASWVAGALAAKLCVTLTLGFDHRVINGAAAARFLARLAALLEEPLRLMTLL